MRFDVFKGKFVEVRTKMNGLEMLGVLKGDDSSLVLDPAIPADAFGNNKYGSENAESIFKKYIALGKMAVMGLDGISSVMESPCYAHIYEKLKNNTTQSQ